jgi:hypothetical protein
MDDSLSVVLQPTWRHSCLLLVHPDIRTLEQAASSLVRRSAWARLPVGAELSTALLRVKDLTGLGDLSGLRPESPRDRPRAAARWFTSRLAAMAPGPVVCSEIDLLFEPTLSLDPLALLRAASRQTRLVALWPGSFVDDVLTYAVAAHDHCRSWRRPEVEIVDLTGFWKPVRSGVRDLDLTGLGDLSGLERGRSNDALP